ncbi:unnamed protein product, partial [marine sediment metagenome]
MRRTRRLDSRAAAAEMASAASALRLGMRGAVVHDGFLHSSHAEVLAARKHAGRQRNSIAGIRRAARKAQCQHP